MAVEIPGPREGGGQTRPNDIPRPGGGSLDATAESGALPTVLKVNGELYPPNPIPPDEETYISVPTNIPYPDAPNNPLQSKSTRRQKAGAIVTIAASLAPLMPAGHMPSADLGPLREPPYSYDPSPDAYNLKSDKYDLTTTTEPKATNGYVDTPKGRLPIINFKLQLDPSKLPTAEGRAVRVTAMDSEPVPGDVDGSTQTEWQYGDNVTIGDEKGIASAVPQPLGAKDSFGLATSSIDPSKGLSVNGDLDGVVVIEQIDEQTGKVVDTGVYQEHFDPSAVCEGGVKVYTGVVDTAETTNVCKIADMYEPFLGRHDPIVAVPVVEKTYEIGGEYSPANDAVRVQLPREKSVQGHAMGELPDVHEFAHAVYESLDPKAKVQLDGTYRILLANMRYRMPTDAEQMQYDTSKNEPLWNFFTESGYTRKLGFDEGIGHPYDNPTEFIASTTASLRTFGDMMPQAYTELDAHDRAFATGGLLAVVDAYQSKSKDPAALRQLFPALPNILTTLAQDPINHGRLPQITQLLRALN